MSENRFLFRGDGRGRQPDGWFVVGCTVVLLGLLAWGHAHDARGERAGFEAGVAAGRQEMAATVAEAYQQGRRDALAAEACAPQELDEPAPVRPALRTAGRAGGCGGAL